MCVLLACRGNWQQKGSVHSNSRRSLSVTCQHSVRQHVLGQPRMASGRCPRPWCRSRPGRRDAARVPLLTEAGQAVQRDLLRRQSHRSRSVSAAVRPPKMSSSSSLLSSPQNTMCTIEWTRDYIQ